MMHKRRTSVENNILHVKLMFNIKYKCRTDLYIDIIYELLLLLLFSSIRMRIASMYKIQIKNIFDGWLRMYAYSMLYPLR